MKHFFSFFAFLGLCISCNFSTDQNEENGDNEPLSVNQRITVAESSKYRITIVLPEGWKVLGEREQWSARESCSDNFCANIVYYHFDQSIPNDSLVNVIVRELSTTYKSTFELISTSPLYNDPVQFSVAYAFVKDTVSLIGYTYVIKMGPDLHMFEVLDNYQNSEEAETKLKDASEFCGSLIVEKF